MDDEKELAAWRRQNVRRGIAINDIRRLALSLEQKTKAWREALSDYEPAWQELDKALAHTKQALDNLDSERRE